MNKWKKMCLPFEKEELKIFIPMVLMMFCFLFNYTILRDTKDTLILTSVGAEAIPYLKFWGTLPASTLFLLFYIKLSNKLKPKILFTVTLTPFFLFFILFGYVLYPFKEVFEPTSLVIYLYKKMHLFPESMHHTLSMLIGLVKNWTCSLFYVLSELWGSMGVSLLFWQFANQITSTENAKRFYPRFTQFGNLSLVASGFFIIYFSNARDQLVGDGDPWQLTLKWLMAGVGLCCFVIFFSYYKVNSYLDKNPQEAKKTTEKPKLGLKESLSLLLRSKYLGLICLLVLSYGITINLIEVVYKSQLSKVFTCENDLCAFIGMVSIFIGLTTFIMVILSNHMLRYMGWLKAAIFTPILFLVTGGIFFTFVNTNLSFFSFTPLWIAVVIGAIQNVLSKACKYALFDPTKEMAYIPLDVDSKVKGKAAIDVAGARLGKSLGGVFLQIVFLFGSIMQNLTLIFSFVTLVIVIWLFAAFKLNKLYAPMVAKKMAS